MNQIEIHNFGPIKEAIIDIKPMLVLIGPQASGKSTIAKLIYFFETLPNDLYSEYINSEKTIINNDDISDILKRKFIKFFGFKKYYSIKYKINNNKAIIISDSNEDISVYLSENFIDYNKLSELKTKLKKTDETDEASSKNGAIPIFGPIIKIINRFTRPIYANSIAKNIWSLFGNRHKDILYTIAGRNSTVGFGYTFEDYFKQNLFQRKASDVQSIDEIIMLDFMKQVSHIKDWFRPYNSFDKIVSVAPQTVKPKLELANELINKVLRGKYEIDSNSEKITHSNGSVYLNEASSGQQEAIRILQDAFLGIHQDDTLFRIVEEPEAHLFPEAQKATIELLTLALNNKNENNLIITTHSPYTLTVINNLIFAAKVGNSSPEKVNEVVPKELWLPTERVAAYLLKDGTAENIIDDELGEIKAEMIDEVSQIINQEYDNIYNIQYETKGENI